MGLVLIAGRVRQGSLAKAKQKHQQRRYEHAHRGARQKMGSVCRHSSIPTTDDEAPTAYAAAIRR